MRLSELFARAGMPFPAIGTDVEITQVTSVSEEIVPGGLFVALRGTKRNGEDFIAQARARGALLVLSEGDRGDLRCSDARLALAHLCRAFYGSGIDRLRLVGVTGTNGKTTVVSLLRSIALAAGRPCGSVGTLGCEIYDSSGRLARLPGEGNMTTPDPEVLYPVLSRMATAGAEYVFTEVSSHALAMKKTDALRFDVGIFTNLTRDHLDFHGTAEEYLNAKARLRGLCDRFLVNADDASSYAFGNDTLRCSVTIGADFFADRIEQLSGGGYRYRVSSDYGRFKLETRMSGGFSVMNTLQAVAAALLLGFAPDDIARGISALKTVSGRMESVLPENADFRVYIDYAHTPDALENVLLSARSFVNGGRLIAVFGCGGDRDRGKRSEMGAIASRLADLTVITSDNPRSESPDAIIEDIAAGVDATRDAVVIPDRRSAIEYAVGTARAGDVIILAGKGHEKYEITASGKHPFDEVLLVRRAFEKRSNGHFDPEGKEKA